MATQTFKRVAAIALKPDGSSESIWCTDHARVGDLDRFGRQINLPPKTIIIPFGDDKFVAIPTYKEALKKKIGHLRP